MPMLDVYIPEGTFPAAREAALINELTEILIRHEGFNPTNPTTRSVSWTFLHRPATVYVGGVAASAPYYKVVPSIPEGQLDAQARADVIREVTEAILNAESGAWPRDPGRIWVFPTEIPEGHWGSNGTISPLHQILTHLGGHTPDKAAALAAQRLTTSRTEHSTLGLTPP
ncbi:hypothetical protein [Nocardia sp. CDC160]|uniref:hypothetical protein n=1 Tax=Nocardia sp. CDC160 TaxID=3112166 RepID=UPI002DB65D31|nr:hypothetical protein [Nocardia sp. CDC160]MEC3916362.1 hypothetical protein [Nocardia sp. CDC160]